MADHKERTKGVVVALMIGGILCLHYFTLPHMRYHHAVYRMFFYLPLVLGSLWFGLKGALYVSVSVSVLYLPHLIKEWQGLSLENFHKLMEGTLYIVIAVILGLLVEKERKKHRALLRAESLVAVGNAVSEVAHDMKTPLMAIGGFAHQVSRKLGQDDPGLGLGSEVLWCTLFENSGRYWLLVTGMNEEDFPFLLSSIQHRKASSARPGATCLNQAGVRANAVWARV